MSNKGNQKYYAGEILADWCMVVHPAHRNASRENRIYTGTWTRASLYYYCGEYKLHVGIPRGISGLWAMVRLEATLVIVSDKGVKTDNNKNGRLIDVMCCPKG